MAAGSAVAAPAQPPVLVVDSGSSPLKILRIAIAVFVVLAILGGGILGVAVWRISRPIHMARSGDQVTMSTPAGTITADRSQTFSESDLGIDIYPGALPGRGSMRMSLSSSSAISAVYVTPDSKNDVVHFYKGKFGSTASVIDTANGTVLTLNKGQRESVVVTVTAKPSQYDGWTQIAILHTTINKSS